jgi:hypothetical protein
MRLFDPTFEERLNRSVKTHLFLEIEGSLSLPFVLRESQEPVYLVSVPDFDSY